MQKYSKYLPILIALCAIADTQFDILIGFGLSANLINSIKLFGLILSIFLPSIQESFQMKINSEEEFQVGKRPKKKGEIDEEF